MTRKKKTSKKKSRPHGKLPAKQHVPRIYQLKFHRSAKDEWDKLDGSVRAPFKKKLEKLLTGEEKPSRKDELSGFPAGFYKIKLRSAGFRLVYQMIDGKLVVMVLAVGKRERNLVYDLARERF